MATSDNVFHPDQVRQTSQHWIWDGFGMKAKLKVNDGMLYSSLAGQVAINDHIAKVSEHKQVVGGDIKDSVIFGMTIGASNPCNRGSLLKSMYVVCLERLVS